MSSEQNKAAKIVCILSAIVLVLAIPDWQYGYYEILRWLVFLSSIFVSYWYYSTESGSKVVWILLFSVTAVLFNPIAPITLDKATWVVLDMVTAMLFVIALVSIWRRSSLGSKLRAVDVEIFLSDDGESIKISNNSGQPLYTHSAILNSSFRIPRFQLDANEERIVKLRNFLDANGSRFDAKKLGIKRVLIKGDLGKRPVEITFGEKD